MDSVTHLLNNWVLNSFDRDWPLLLTPLAVEDKSAFYVAVYTQPIGTSDLFSLQSPLSARVKKFITSTLKSQAIRAIWLALSSVIYS